MEIGTLMLQRRTIDVSDELRLGPFGKFFPVVFTVLILKGRLTPQKSLLVLKSSWDSWKIPIIQVRWLHTLWKWQFRQGF